ncbi:MAG: hypothetical protein KAJ51_06190, partial [Thermoplasmata archaeon]|nr:hypothetical protein [Thermoplasmata archaeon]
MKDKNIKNWMLLDDINKHYNIIKNLASEEYTPTTYSIKYGKTKQHWGKLFKSFAKNNTLVRKPGGFYYTSSSTKELVDIINNYEIEKELSAEEVHLQMISTCIKDLQSDKVLIQKNGAKNFLSLALKGKIRLKNQDMGVIIHCIKNSEFEEI